MQPSSPRVREVLQAIQDADLPHPGGALIEAFIQESADNELAVGYFQYRCPFILGQGALVPVVADLKDFLADWTALIAAFDFGHLDEVQDKVIIGDITARDGGRCRITDEAAEPSDPLVVVQILRGLKEPLHPRLHDMLRVFVTPALSDWAVTAELGTSYHNLWLARKSAATAFAQGFVKLKFEQYGGDKYYRVWANYVGQAIGQGPPQIINHLPHCRFAPIKDRSAKGIATPAPQALLIRSHFAEPFRLLCIAQDIARRTRHTPSRWLDVLASLKPILEPCITALISLWSRVPDKLRLKAYHGLAFLGDRWYEPTCSLHVQKLPFGLYLKTQSLDDHKAAINEYGALKTVRRHIPNSSVAIPRPLDLVADDKISYLLTSAVPGNLVGRSFDTMTDEEVTILAQDLREWLIQLRAIPRTVAPGDHQIANAVGQDCYDYRLTSAVPYDPERGDYIGPFADEDALIEMMRCGALPDVVHQGGHEIVFTHGDLNLRNVLVKDGKLSGIVYWATAGWYPEYWDYTKAHLVTKHHWRWKKMLDKVFAELGDYREELKTEKELWEYCY